MKEGDKNMSELSMIEGILTNIIKRKQKTLYNMTYAHYIPPEICQKVGQP